MAPPTPTCELGHVRFIPLSYDNEQGDTEAANASARKLILTLAPEWKDESNSNLKFVRFTDGITNTLLKVVNERPGLTKAQVDRDAILLRAYGKGTAVLIDREREAANHELLMMYDLAPALLARFENGMLYRYVSGTVANHHDLREPSTLLAIARRLAEWHATVPCITDAFLKSTSTQAERDRQSLLLKEMKHLVEQLSQRPGLGQNGLVFAHCDLLCANIIMHKDEAPASHAANGTNGHTQNSDVSNSKDKPVTQSVSFIDYEYATPSPAAFDIANHFAEWAGFECDYTMVPTQAHRRTFISEYMRTYIEMTGEKLDHAEETQKLYDEVDIFRGVPGFYWGIWALIQAMISEIDFDYATYAESRLGEYWAHKAETDGSRAASGEEMPLRERTWARTA